MTQGHINAAFDEDLEVLDALIAKMGNLALSQFITVIDGHPATLSWLGGVAGHKTLPLGVEEFGQTGTISDLYRQANIDADAIANKAQYLTAGAPF